MKGLEQKMENLFIDILFYCGLRRLEALALTVNDIDFQRREIIINKSLSWIKGTRIKEPKSTCSIRRVNTPNSPMDELKSYILE